MLEKGKGKAQLFTRSIFCLYIFHLSHIALQIIWGKPPLFIYLFIQNQLLKAQYSGHDYGGTAGNKQ